MQFAGFWIRVGAYLIDAILLAIFIYLFQSLTGINMGASYSANMGDLSAAGGEDVASPLGSVISFLIYLVYFAGLESSAWQATVGKKALGLIVVDTSGNRISFLRALGRFFGRLLSAIILMIGYIMVAFTEKKQGLHDKLASTYVLKGQPGEYSTAGVFE
ncbi:RDD family protein [Aurantiacibacter rhizosphaerae]|uniref:RDD family protein n=1 Tax=Aurantiacibacter rhizosphaerae TaxID=2691582 RepID=UPI0019233BA8